MLVYGPGMGFKHVAGTWSVSKFSFDALRPPVTSTSVCKRTIRPGKCLPLPFLSDTGTILVTGISSLETFGTTVIVVSPVLTVEGTSDATSNNSTIVYIHYTIFTATAQGVSSSSSSPSPFYNVLSDAESVLTINQAILFAGVLDVELFNNDPDVAVDEYVLIFKRKP